MWLMLLLLIDEVRLLCQKKREAFVSDFVKNWWFVHEFISCRENRLQTSTRGIREYSVIQRWLTVELRNLPQFSVSLIPRDIYSSYLDRIVITNKTYKNNTKHLYLFLISILKKKRF